LPALWLAWSPDSKWVVLDNGKVFNLADRKARTLFKIADPARRAFALHTQGETESYIWSPDSKWLLVERSSAKVNEPSPGWQVHDTSNGKAWALQQLPRNGLVKWSPDSQRVIAGGRLGEPATGQFSIFEIPSGKPTKLGASPEASSLVAVAWSPDGKRVATGSGAGAVRVWDADTHTLLLSFATSGRVVALAWSNDGRLFAANAAGAVKIWDTATKQELPGWTVNAPKDPWPDHPAALNLQFSPDASRLALESPEAVHLYDAVTGKLLSKLKVAGHVLTWRPDGNAVLVRDNRDYTRSWDVTTGDVIATFYKPDDKVSPAVAVWSPDGRRLAFASGTDIKVHDAVTGKEALTLRRVASDFPGWEKPDPNRLPFNLLPISALAWSPDGWRLAAQFAVKRADWKDPQPRIKIWNAKPSD
jgi:WD40 repeat protein